MGRKRSSRKARTGRRGFENDGGLVPGGLDRVSKVEGKILLNMTTSSNHFEVGLTPFLDSKLGVLATQYELFRFTWLKFTVHPSDNSTSNEQAIGFLPDRPTATGFPASLEEVLQLAYSKYMGAREIDPIWIAIKRVGLLGRTALKWWDTDTTASEATYQGRILCRTAQAAVILRVVLEYQIEFTNPIPATVTLARIAKFQRLGYLPTPTEAEIEGASGPPQADEQVQPPVQMSRDRAPAQLRPPFPNGVRPFTHA